MNKEFADHNIILISLDGMRQDKISLSPNIKKLIEESIYFPKMFTVAPYTLAAHHAIISGMYPSQNGVDAYYHMFRFKKEQIKTISELLQENGYFTCCDIASESLMPNQGFDEKNIYDEKTVNFQSRHKELILKLSKRQKFFLFLQYSDPHKHLVEEVMKKYDQKSNDDDYYSKIEENEKRYNSFMPECDRYVESILKTLKSLSLDKKTIVIFTSDHGTSIGEKKGERFYGVYVYDYTINVFSIIHIPGIKPETINFQCRNIDLFPTVAEFAGISLEELSYKISGKSLWSFIEKRETSDREVFVETGGLYGFWPSPKKHNVFCIRKNDKKLIFNDTPNTFEFYNLKTDPKEQKNIFDEESSDVKDFKKTLVEFLNNNNISTKLT